MRDIDALTDETIHKAREEAVYSAVLVTVLGLGLGAPQDLVFAIAAAGAFVPLVISMLSRLSEVAIKAETWWSALPTIVSTTLTLGLWGVMAVLMLWL